MAVVSLLFIAGLFFLCKGGDLLVDSAVFFARKFHISEIIIGAVILSIGTSFPEITVSATAAMQGVSAISYGNAVGSVICNTALIGGILCLFLPSNIKSGEIFKSVVFFCIATAICFCSSAASGKIGTVISVLLLGVFFWNAVFTVRTMRNTGPIAKNDEKPVAVKGSSLAKGTSLAIGCILILAGSRLLIDNGIRIANALHVPDRIIAITFIALGTSLPELITAIASISKGHAELSFGNLIGGDLLNMTAVIGVSGIISPIKLTIALFCQDLPFMMLAFALLVLPVFLKKRTFRLQGAALLFLYAYYCFRLFWIVDVAAWIPYIL